MLQYVVCLLVTPRVPLATSTFPSHEGFPCSVGHGAREKLMESTLRRSVCSFSSRAFQLLFFFFFFLDQQEIEKVDVLERRGSILVASIKSNASPLSHHKLAKWR